MEALHKDLVPYQLCGRIHHKLIPVSLLNDASRINELYRQKKEMVARAEAEGDWYQYVFLHERPYRLDALPSAAKKGLSRNPSAFWKLVGDVWQDSENIRQNLAKWKRIWSSPIEDREACMSGEDIRIFKSLSDEVEVWRGMNHKHYKRGLGGLSWTLDQDKAIWFASRFPHWGRPLVAKAVINKPDVLAYFGGRNESEIVSMQVRIVSVTEIGKVECIAHVRFRG
jgi:hypothetical protein